MNSLFYIYMLLCIAVATRREEDITTEYVDEEYDDSEYEVFSLNGMIRRSFAMRAAVENDRKVNNMICSPVSALLPLGKLVIGAQKDALRELLDSIGIAGKSKLRSHFKTLLEDLKHLPGVSLDVASRIYLSNQERVQRKFIDRTREIFDSSAEKIDFSVPREAAQAINFWVARKTNGMITNLFSPSEISADSSLVLVNAIYFAGQWKHPFDDIHTGNFFTPKSQKKVPMMTKRAWYNYAKSRELGAQLIEIPYQGDGASFIILLPNQKEGLPALLSQLKIAPRLLDSELSKMSKLKVTLTIPKFKIETELNLRDIYGKLGLRNIFDPINSELKKIVRDKSVYVSTAKQKAVIEVTELGTEAAAASGLAIIGLQLDIHREIMNCNHPFLFFVRLRKQQLFAGILNDP